ncbi:ATP translocase [Kangiella sediminilitoris]|uniref:ATP/ADP translocase-like protein n=1 Tax=Kangiella sediminilitoris TaxID=1144748 RepID=A0A1B3B965_9GAMM|nr:ATP translocase [Kangiella sediminilitoris]AOE49342.1 ATP/ADP translocase-like protein [Kangiella sediminilitoris]
MDEHRSFSRVERLLAPFVWIRAGEGRSVVLMFFSLFILMLAYYLLKVIRDPLILSDGSAELKSYTTSVQAIILLGVIPLFSKYYYKFSDYNDKSLFLRRVLLFFVSHLLIFAVAKYAGLPIGIAFYIWLGVFSVTMVALYWAFCADCFNPMSGKRLFAIIAIGGTTGAWVGAQLAGLLYPILDITGLLMLSAILLTTLNFLIRSSYRAVPESSKSSSRNKIQTKRHQWWEGFSLFFNSRYLMLIGVFILLYNWINSIGEYVLAKFVVNQALQLAEKGSHGEQLYMTEFYSSYIAWFTLIGLLLQLFVVSRLFRWIGVGASVFILPFVMVINYTMILFFPFFTVVKWALIAENSVNYSIQNTSRHALFLPVSRDEKYLSKNTTDTFFYRFGDVMSGGSVFIGVQLFGLGTFEFITFNTILAGICCWTALSIRRHYKLQDNGQVEGRPPELALSLQPEQLTAGNKTIVSIPENTFIDPDPGDMIRYQLKAGDGCELPSWCHFNHELLTVTFMPPPATDAKLKLVLVATDFAGFEASTDWEVTVKPEVDITENT